ncbi:MAG: tetratricopeptide repeat protein [Spirochaetales bacterium]|nr:tetratricopeptide repeat protein [Spirochaetales bacterium]
MDEIFDGNKPDSLRGMNQDHEKENAISELSKRGYQLLKENRTEEAEACFSKILEEQPENNYALVGMGDTERKRHRYKSAINFYMTCLEHHPGNNYALFGLADCHKALRQYSQAIRIWEKYLLYDNSNITVLTRVADAYRKVKDFKRSKEIYLEVLEMEKDNAYALIGIGHLYYDFHEYADALKYWERMLEVTRDHVDIRVLTSLGNCHRKLKTFEKGLVYFEMAYQAQPTNFYALFGLADCYRGLNMHKESLQFWEKILAMDPQNKVILTRSGDAYRNMNDYDNAEIFYKKALNIEMDVYAVLGLAMINKSKGNYAEAIVSLEGLIKSDPKNHRLYVEIAECYVSMKETQKAISILMDFQKLGLRDTQVSQYLEQLRFGTN